MIFARLPTKATVGLVWQIVWATRCLRTSGRKFSRVWTERPACQKSARENVQSANHELNSVWARDAPNLRSCVGQYFTNVVVTPAIYLEEWRPDGTQYANSPSVDKIHRTLSLSTSRSYLQNLSSDRTRQEGHNQVPQRPYPYVPPGPSTEFLDWLRICNRACSQCLGQRDRTVL